MPVASKPGLAALAVIAALAVTAASAQAAYVVTGHGYGHGVGLAQYGAMGYARDGRWAYWIVAHYFSGTTQAEGPAARVRVRLKEPTKARISGANRAVAADGRRLSLDGARTYRFIPWGATGLQVIDVRTGHTVAHLRGPVRLTGRSTLWVAGPAENGVTDGRYRGAIVLSGGGTDVLVVDEATMQQYLQGVVPGEMPASWPAAALRAQAITARSYALTSLQPGRPFDVYADTRSQMYRGVVAERPSTTAAVQDTGRTVVMAGPTVAHTLFHSSSGGRTAAVEEVFGGAPVSYLKSVDDPFDRLSPYHDWTVTLSDDEAAKRLAPVLAGALTDIEVVARTASGRAALVRVTGTLGSSDIDGRTARTLLGLRSTWFDVASAGAPHMLAPWSTVAGYAWP